jgi:hypothetical protein
MSGLRAWFVTAAALAFAALAIEPPQDPPGIPAKPEPAEQEPEQPQPAPEAGDETAPAPEPEAADEELPPLPPDTDPGPSPQRFNPTEKVRADFPVSFPIDI